MTRPAARDVIVPGSARHVVIHEEYTLVTVRCGRCGNEQEARSDSRTTRCKECDRTCRLPVPAPHPEPRPAWAGGNVIPLRRTA